MDLRQHALATITGPDIDYGLLAIRGTVAEAAPWVALAVVGESEDGDIIVAILGKVCRLIPTSCFQLPRAASVRVVACLDELSLRLWIGRLASSLRGGGGHRHDRPGARRGLHRSVALLDRGAPTWATCRRAGPRCRLLPRRRECEPGARLPPAGAGPAPGSGSSSSLCKRARDPPRRCPGGPASLEQRLGQSLRLFGLRCLGGF